MKKTFLPWRNAQIALLSLSLSIALVSCEKDQVDTNGAVESIGAMKSASMEDILPDVHTQIVLGDVLENPYSVESMRAAFDYYNDNVPDSPYQEKEVIATHYYIKIQPETEAHRVTLDNLDNTDDLDAPTLHDYPLDREIIQEGDYYIMPESSNDVYHAAYSVIPVDYSIVQPVPYTILSELYLPSDDEFDVESIALVFANWQDDLVADFGEEIYPDDLAELLPAWVDASSQKRLFGRKYRPAGRIRVENSDMPGDANAQNFERAKISIGRNFSWTYTYTNEAGNFTASKSYRGKVRIRAKFRSDTATVRKEINEIVGLWISDHVMTITRGSNNPDRIVRYLVNSIFGGTSDIGGGHLWTKATTHIGLVRYNRYAEQNGITERLNHANVWAWSNGSSSVTPMLRKFSNLANIAVYGNVGQANIWQNLTAGLTAVGINMVPLEWRPDIIFQGLGDRDAGTGVKSNTVRIHQLVFHEAGHYSHAIKAGENFWSRNMAATIGNSIGGRGSYSDGSRPSFQAADRISIIEGWATFTEFKITNFYYDQSFVNASTDFGLRNINNIETIMENFNMFQRPMEVTRRDDQGWFMHGLFWDLLDNRNEIPIPGIPAENRSRLRTGNNMILNSIRDNCNISIVNDTNNLGPVFIALGAQEENACDLLHRLRGLYPAQENALIELFTSYGYPCGQALP